MSDRGDHGLNARALTFGHCTPPLDHPRFPKAVNSQMHGVLYKLSLRDRAFWRELFLHFDVSADGLNSRACRVSDTGLRNVSLRDSSEW
ncbi:hypothetical protein AAEP93_003080 [Penicillium crustosum]